MGYKEIVNDIQDSDQEMEDSNQESDEDEGSLYAPTEATSELGEENSNEYEGTMKPPPMDPCMFLVLLPRELRDKVCAHLIKWFMHVRILSRYAHASRFTNIS